MRQPSDAPPVAGALAGLRVVEMAAIRAVPRLSQTSSRLTSPERDGNVDDVLARRSSTAGPPA
ncbi:hypothetical protein [Novosphingobium colocasiae]|uniref:Uncharacterized protein n=1 Tax=Novosphingobium colocasiae TaxID=1256513 RepID=A0A918UK49_9SPHN|nr:hypothetical protein [Novosphingobium colocasiae]GGZ15665.1 hypothetical protein GCM10011614_33230 [Novosphingobium colocasiae]